jgi:hypothetical protein
LSVRRNRRASREQRKRRSGEKGLFDGHLFVSSRVAGVATGKKGKKR